MFQKRNMRNIQLIFFSLRARGTNNSNSIWNGMWIDDDDDNNTHIYVNEIRNWERKWCGIGLWFDYDYDDARHILQNVILLSSVDLFSNGLFHYLLLKCNLSVYFVEIIP